MEVPCWISLMCGREQLAFLDWQRPFGRASLKIYGGKAWLKRKCAI